MKVLLIRHGNTDRQPHCGGCHHNCLLENAGFKEEEWTQKLLNGRREKDG